MTVARRARPGRQCKRAGRIRVCDGDAPINLVMDLLPAVVTMGIHEFQRSMSRAWRGLEAGDVIHLVHKRAGLHRAWLVPELEPGCEAPEPVTCSMLREHLGQVFELVALGTVVQVRDEQGANQHKGHGEEAIVRGYLQWTPPEGIARLDRALQYATRLPRTAYGGGGRRLRDIWPTEVQART
jgi:hypothetical protein